MEQENSLIPEEEIKNPEILEISTNDEPVAAESKAVENAKEKKEVPEIDFSILSTEEIIRQAQKLINDYPVVSLKEIFEGLPEIFESRYKEEYEKALAIFTADGDKPEDFEYKNFQRDGDKSPTGRLIALEVPFRYSASVPVSPGIPGMSCPVLLLFAPVLSILR